MMNDEVEAPDALLEDVRRASASRRCPICATKLETKRRAKFPTRAAGKCGACAISLRFTDEGALDDNDDFNDEFPFCPFCAYIFCIGEVCDLMTYVLGLTPKARKAFRKVGLEVQSDEEWYNAYAEMQAELYSDREAILAEQPLEYIHLTARPAHQLAWEAVLDLSCADDFFGSQSSTKLFSQDNGYFTTTMMGKIVKLTPSAEFSDGRFFPVYLLHVTVLNSLQQYTSNLENDAKRHALMELVRCNCVILMATCEWKNRKEYTTQNKKKSARGKKKRRRR